MSGTSPQVDIEDIYELSPMQLGMLFQSLLAPSSGVFVEQQAMRLTNAVLGVFFERAWQVVVDRTPVLRTSFHWGDLEKPVQVVHRRVPVWVDQLDWRGVPAGRVEEHLNGYMREVRRRGFALDQAPLMRLALARTSDAETWFIWHFHHLLLDGWSGQLLMQEFIEEYRAQATGRRYDPPERRPFSAYIEWLQSQDESEAEAFWRAHLSGITGPTPIGIGRAAIDERQAGNEGEHMIALPVEETEALRAFAKGARLTLNTVAQGAWAILLGRYSGQAEVVHGVVVSGRPPELPGVDQMIGLFINTIPVRILLPADDILLTWLQQVQRQQIGITRYQHISMLKLQQWLGVPSGTRLCETVVVFENFPVATTQNQDDTEEPLYLGRTDVSITLVLVPGKTLRIKFLYDDRRFEAQEIDRMAEYFAGLLKRLPSLGMTRLRDISLLTAAARERMLLEWNQTAVAGYDSVPLMRLLEERAARMPNAIAYIEGDECITVAEVHERSNRLARLLAEEGVRTGTVVGVCSARSIAAVTALLAVLKCRAVFLPLDPSYPRERLAYMAADSGAQVLLGFDAEVGGVARALTWSDAWERASSQSASNCQEYAEPGDLAYLIYTSGSTGRPKGVAVEHRAVLNRLHWMWREYPFVAGEVLAMKTPLNFVDAFWEMLGGLLAGVPTAIMPPEIVAEPAAFVHLLAQHAVTRLWFVPSFLELLLETCPDLGRQLPKLRSWWSGGEQLSGDLYRRFQASVPGGTLYNVFGASELWDATVFDPRRDGAVTDWVPIGRPIANTAAYILDADRQPAPVGVTGSLFIGGASVARGYINQGELTRQRFIPHPFDATPGARLYDTGDLARFRADGVIEYAGRRDLQLNVRGFRVEPAEIESLLEAHPSVRESAVICHRPDERDQRLAAYVAPRGDVRDTAALLEHLRRWLPSFMVPTITWIDAIPMTPSGKRDRNRLPASVTTYRGAEPGEAPNPLEAVVTHHFCEVLGLDSVRREEDFFADLGGHSLLATRLVSRLQESTGVEVPLRVVFDARTPAAIAAAIGRRMPAPAVDAKIASLVADLATQPEEEVAALLASLEAESAGGEP
jgi:amino acid adenylation domain-containing protein